MWVVLASGLLTPKYTATGLTNGLLYNFKVEARNTVGYSNLSQPIALLCALAPEAPAQPTTVLNTIANTVTVNWDTSVNNGDPITSYKI